MFITAAQCRAARALLGWSQRELEARAKVSKKAIADFERGASEPYARTMRDIFETLDAAGIQFLNAEDGVGGPGVRFKLGVEIPDRTRKEGSSANDAGERGFDALNWEDDFSGEERIEKDPELIAYWSAHPEQWTKLSDTGKRVLSNMMFGSPEAADEAFGNDAR
jgi:transcriptional regulator with XRE-family HTH domain